MVTSAALDLNFTEADPAGPDEQDAKTVPALLVKVPGTADGARRWRAWHRPRPAGSSRQPDRSRRPPWPAAPPWRPARPRRRRRRPWPVSSGHPAGHELAGRWPAVRAGTA